LATAPHIDEHLEPISVSSDVLARLGEELITNHVQALAELIKNSYDADATQVRVDIETQWAGVAPDGQPRRGRLMISDNGLGMDEDAVRQGWLRVSASRKRAMKDAGQTTPRKRTPLGDKGLGRLGTQRIGDLVRIRTRPRPSGGALSDPASIEHDVHFAFSNFRTDLDVSGIEVPWRRYELPSQAELTGPWKPTSPTGTQLEIYGLSNTDDWSDTAALERDLSLLVNPYKGVEKFAVAVVVDGKRLALESVASAVRDAALARWEGTFDGQTLSFDGLVRLQWFNVRDVKERAQLAQLTAEDNGRGLRDFVLKQSGDREFGLTGGDGKPWLLKIQYETALAGLDQTDIPQRPVEGVEGKTEPVSPGEFLFELDVVTRQIGTARAAGFSAFDRGADYTKWLNERGGVHVYRDGFRINLGDDVMRLGEGFSNRRGHYGIRPANAIGYIEISAADNPGLEETTDREGFRDTPEVVVFRRLIKELRDKINDALDLLGRATLDYLRSQVAEENETTEELAEDLASAAEEAAAARVVLEAAVTHVKTVATAAPDDADKRNAALKAIGEAIAKADAALERTVAADRLAAVVQQDLEALNERVEEYAQLIGLGLVAETLSHELSHASARLAEQVADLQARRSDLEPWARGYLQEARAALDALSGQLRHLDPMLRYARTRSEEIDLGQFANDMAAFHRDRLARKRIKIEVSCRSPAAIKANRGRLMQVFDNVVINAEYWLEQAVAVGRLAEGVISVQVSGSSMLIQDNGPGVDPKLETRIFEPFVTAKSDRGRGLGLFICRQLLDLDEGRIVLGPHRNQAGRADSFEIYFEQPAR